MSRLAVVGSYNASMFFRGERAPGPGETVIGDGYWLSAGGKGSNQAIAAKYQGADVGFVGKLGADAFGDEAIAMYCRVGLSTDLILRDGSAHTGVAGIFIDAEGANRIMVCPGANLKLTAAEMVDGARGAALAGFQLENDLSAVAEAICALRQRGVQTLLDPAPAAPLPVEVYQNLSFIKPNEHEAAALTGIAVQGADDAFRAADELVARGVGCAIVTLGGGGVVAVGRGLRAFVPALDVRAADTTGAGDVFCGALMAGIVAGWPLLASIEYANCAGALSVTRMGVLEATPDRRETEAAYAAWRAAHG
ncbi:MAG: ribokinase [Clostridiales bacterium]|nr:ribokinase [Clostridiales bacterium]